MKKAWTLIGLLLLAISGFIIVREAQKPQTQESKAAVKNARIFLLPATLNLTGEQTLQLWITSDAPVVFARAEISFDKTRVKLNQPVTLVSPGLGTTVSLTNPTDANANGKIVIVVAKDPAASAPAPNGTFQLASFKMAPNTTQQNISTTIDVLTAGSQLVADDTSEFTLTKGASSVVVNPTTTITSSLTPTRTPTPTPNPAQTVTPTPTPFTQTGCVRAGCSGQICMNAGSSGGNTTCEARPEYACYNSARCEKQSNGLCAWTQTTALLTCLSAYYTPTPTPTVTGSTCTSSTQCMEIACNGGGFIHEVCVNGHCVLNSACPTLTPTPTPNANQKTLQFNVKLAGVTDGSAQGAKISVKFSERNGTITQLSSPLSLTHISGGVYKATATVTNLFPAGTQLRAKIKGEKHISVQFCRQTGQTGPCGDAEYITMPTGSTITFDVTGIPLPPGDLADQDGQANRADLDKLTPLMAKICSTLTTAEKLVGDVDYNGCVNVRDVFLILQSLETRYDQ